MDQKIEIATRAAAAVMLFTGPDGLDKYDWPLLGSELTLAEGVETTVWALDDEMARRTAILATFVRAFPEASIEALYRHAGGQGVHDRPADGFDDIEPAFRIAYAVFRATLIEADRVFAEEERRAAARAEQDRPQPPLLINAEDTILEQHGRIFEKIGDRPEPVNLGGPVVAASEGEGGDGKTTLTPGHVAMIGDHAIEVSGDHPITVPVKRGKR